MAGAHDASVGLREQTAPPGEVAAAGRGARRLAARPGTTSRWRDRLGGSEGNEVLTAAAAALLTVLLIAEGLTILRIGGLLTPHMLIGLALIPPVLLKLSSTSYRFVRYYTRAPSYRRKGPPQLVLRLLAPVLVATTVGVFATGIWLLALGHRSDQLLFLHKAFFVAWGAVFGIHFLAYAPRVARSLRSDWGRIHRQRVPGSGLRGMLVAASLGTGAALALALLGSVTGWHGGAG